MVICHVIVAVMNVEPMTIAGLLYPRQSRCMRTRPVVVLVSSCLTLASISCVTATPVAPSPLAPARLAELQGRLLGTCHVTATQKVGGSLKEAKGIHWTFSADGRLHWQINAMYDIEKDYAYSLDGANVVTTSPYRTMRVDDFSGPTLAFFLYDLSETYFCSKESP
jgi:hypothetical protein